MYDFNKTEYLLKYIGAATLMIGFFLQILRVVAFYITSKENVHKVLKQLLKGCLAILILLFVLWVGIAIYKLTY